MQLTWHMYKSPSPWPAPSPVSQPGQKGKSERNPDAFTLYFYFARTASIHFLKAQLCQHDVTISISIYFQLNSPWIDSKKIILSFAKDQPIYCHSWGSNAWGTKCFRIKQDPKWWILSLSTVIQLSPEKWKETSFLNVIMVQNLSLGIN